MPSQKIVFRVKNIGVEFVDIFFAMEIKSAKIISIGIF